MGGKCPKCEGHGMMNLFLYLPGYFDKPNEQNKEFRLYFDCFDVEVRMDNWLFAELRKIKDTDEMGIKLLRNKLAKVTKFVKAEFKRYGKAYEAYRARVLRAQVKRRPYAMTGKQFG